MVKRILADPVADTPSGKAWGLLQAVAVDIPKTRNAGKGIGSAREAPGRCKNADVDVRQ
jgi:hypothetical protein